MENFNNLKKIKNGRVINNWSDKEIYLLFHFHRKYGNKWTSIAKRMQDGRGEKDVKNWFFSFLRKSIRKIQKKDSDPDDFTDPLKLEYLEYIANLLKYNITHSDITPKWAKNKNEPYLKKLIKWNNLTVEEIDEFLQDLKTQSGQKDFQKEMFEEKIPLEISPVPIPAKFKRTELDQTVTCSTLNLPSLRNSPVLSPASRDQRRQLPLFNLNPRLPVIISPPILLPQGEGDTHRLLFYPHIPLFLPLPANNPQLV